MKQEAKTQGPIIVVCSEDLHNNNNSILVLALLRIFFKVNKHIKQQN